jgi:hypothetical protein
VQDEVLQVEHEDPEQEAPEVPDPPVHLVKWHESVHALQVHESLWHLAQLHEHFPAVQAAETAETQIIRAKIKAIAILGSSIIDTSHLIIHRREI